MRPGALSQQYNVCGNPRCRCKDPQHPQKHSVLPIELYAAWEE
ncbi:MAG: DUF6788 family protein [Candidatus Hinthialibacter sp.]